MTSLKGLRLWAAGSSMIASVAAAVCIAPGAASAQQASTQKVDASGLEEVIVTAQRRKESAQDVPIAVTALSADTLQDAGVVQMPEIAQLTPGLQFTSIGATAMPFLRGVGATTSALGSESAVPIYIDDVYISSTPASLMALNSIENIAVLRGPQGTLFGRNASGGVIQITTRVPGQTPRLDASVGYANYETSEASVYGSHPLTDNIAGDVAIYYRTQNEGWGDNVTTGGEVFTGYDAAFRGRLAFDFSSSTRLILSGQYFKVKNQVGFATTRLAPGELDQNERYAGGESATEGFYDVALNDWSGNRTDVRGASANFQHDFGFANFRSISAFTHLKYEGFVDFDFGGNPAARTLVRLPPKQDTTSQEFQLISPDNDSQFSWVGGVFLMHDVAEYEDQLTRAPPFQQILNTRQETDSWAVYGQGTYNFTAQTTLTLGARYTEDERDWRGTAVTVAGAGPPNRDATGKRTYGDANYRVALDHHLTDNVMIYASYTTGFKSGFFSNQTIQVNPADTSQGLPVKPETVKAWEAGVKSVLAGGSLRLNGSAFTYDYRDMQVNAFLDNVTRLTINAAAADIWGVDFDSEWRATDDLTFTLSAEWLDATYDSFPGAPFFTMNPAPGGGLTASLNDAAGNDLTNSPEFSGTLGVNYTIPLVSGELALSGNVYYNSGIYFEPQNRLKQDSYTLLGAAATWTSADRRWDVMLWGRNLTDEKVFSAGNPTAGPSGGDSMSPRPPRTFGVRAGVHF